MKASQQLIILLEQQLAHDRMMLQRIDDIIDSTSAILDEIDTVLEEENNIE